MLRVVVDPNVLILAVLTPVGIPGQAVEAARGSRYLLVVPPLLLDEVEEVLARDRVRRRLPPGAAERFLIELRALGDLVPNAGPPSTPLTRDPDDDYLVALARAAGADVLVSGIGISRSWRLRCHRCHRCSRRRLSCASSARSSRARRVSATA